MEDIPRRPVLFAMEKWREGKWICYKTYALEDNNYRMKAIGQPYASVIVIRPGDMESLVKDSNENSGLFMPLAGTYISEATGIKGKYISDSSGELVTIVQTENQIEGSFERGGKFWGEIRGSTIKFDWSTPGGASGVGEWKVNDDGSELYGTWINGGRHYDGTLKLRRTE